MKTLIIRNLKTVTVKSTAHALNVLAEMYPDCQGCFSINGLSGQYVEVLLVHKKLKTPLAIIL